MGGDRIEKLIMPKWGLSMTQGKVVEWLVDEGQQIDLGKEVLEVETEKITGLVESPVAGVLRRQVAASGQDVPVAGLLGVLADPAVSEQEIDDFVERFVPDTSHDESGSSTAEDPQTVEVLGKTAHYLKRGEGNAPALLIHGFGGNLNNWLFNHETLAAERTVYALDLPGHGRSSKNVGDGTIGSLVDGVHAWCDAVDVPKVHLIGHSLGGLIALSLALRHPERVHSCTLVASVGLGSEIDHEYIHSFVHAERRNQLKAQLQKLFADQQQVTRQLVDDVLKFKRLDGVHDALRTISEKFIVDRQQATVLRDRLPDVSVPVMVIWGQQDQILPVSHSESLPDSVAVHVIPGCGHMVQMEAANEVNRVINAFLE